MQHFHARRLYVGTTAERTGLSLDEDARGVLFYDTDLSAFYLWGGSSWMSVSGASAIEDLSTTETDTDKVLVPDGANGVGWTYRITDNITKTVKSSGGDFTTIQDAINWFKGRLVAGACVIEVDPGTYVENVIFQDLFIGNGATLTIQGDTRDLAGLSFVDGGPCNPAGRANGGSGTCALSGSSGLNTITVTGSVTNPDFDTDSWENGDEVLVYDNAGSVTEYTISAVAVNVITLTANLTNSVGNDGTAICLLPNRRIAPAAGDGFSFSNVRGVQVSGFVTSVSGSNIGIALSSMSQVTLSRVLTRSGVSGIRSTDLSNCVAVDCSAWDSTNGFQAYRFGQIISGNACAVANTYGFHAQYFANIFGIGEITAGNSQGFRCALQSHLFADNSYARACSIGYYAVNNAFIRANNTSVNNSSTTGYNPSPSGSEGNISGIIVYS